MRSLELLPVDKMRCLKVVQIEGRSWNPFFGYLPYLRPYNPNNYDPMVGDALDAKILESLHSAFPESRHRYATNILFKDDLEENLRTLEGGSRKEFIIQFNPLIPYSEAPFLVNKTFYAYPLGFSVRMHVSEATARAMHINEYFLCSLPYKEIDEIVKTIEGI